MLVFKANHGADVGPRHLDDANFTIGEHFKGAGAQLKSVFVFGLIFLPLGSDAPTLEVIYLGFVIEMHRIGRGVLAFGAKNPKRDPAVRDDLAIVFYSDEVFV